MRPLAEDIWVEDASIRAFGVPIGARMTVVRLENGNLWLHSPVEIDEERSGAVDDLGSVRYIVAPNRFHHMFVDGWVDEYPDAELWGAPGLPDKRDDLDFDRVLTRDEAPWTDQIEQTYIDGADLLSEVVFYHDDSRTLVSVDLLFNEHDPDSFLSTAYLWINGILGRPGISRLVKFAFDDASTVRASYEKLFDWDFERIVLAHGDIVEDRARETLRDVVDDFL